MPIPAIVIIVAPVVGPLIGVIDVITARSIAMNAAEELA
jgi:hypothetical protein